MHRISRFHFGASTAMLTALLASSAYAQTVGAPAPTSTAAGPVAANAPAASPALTQSGDIIVTARRKAEDIQRVPVSVTALGSNQLRAAGVVKLADIANVVPGVNLFFNGNEHNPIYSIRGLSRGSLGFQQPAVTTYVNDVPTTIYDSALPTYDIASIQVLKGPQGTLFGRNSEAGAMLVATQQPTYNFNGYVDTTLGSYSWTKLDGAINVPIIADKLAVRVAGDYNRRDGYTRNLSFPGNDFNNIHNQSFRVSVLAQPVEGLKNILVVEHMDSRTNGSPPSLLSYDPNAPGLPNVVPGALGIGDAYDRQVANGPRTAIVPFLVPESYHATSVTNTTSLDLGSVTVKNIFGYRQTSVENFVNQSGYDFPLVSGYTAARYKQITDEFQVSGKTLDNHLTYIVGGFYLDYRPNGDNYIIVAPPGTGAGTGSSAALLNTPLGQSDYYHDTSKSVYGQVNYDFGGLAAGLSGLSVDAGLRYSKDIHRLCAVSNVSAVDPASEAECRTTAGNSARSSGGQWSYTAGLNYQVDRNLLLYAVTRRGYRAGGLNAPIFGGTLTSYQAFKPETVHDVELGLKSRFSVGEVPVTANVAVFQGKYKNLQTGINTNGIDAVLNTPAFAGGVDGDGNPGNNPTPLFYANVGSGRVRGVEASVEVKATHALRLGGNLSYLSTKITSDTFVPPVNWPAFLVPGAASFASTIFYGAPKFSYGGSVDYTLPVPSRLGQMVAHANVVGSSTIKYDAITVRPKAVLDLRFDWNSVFDSRIDLSAFVTNVTNKLYVAAPGLGTVGAFAFTSGNYNEPRIFGAQMRVHFGTP